jgi:hypothetical protein
MKIVHNLPVNSSFLARKLASSVLKYVAFLYAFSSSLNWYAVNGILGSLDVLFNGPFEGPVE